MRTSTENMNHCLIFLREIFCVIIVLCLNILWLKAVNEITAMQTRTSLRKHDVIKVCSIEYLTTQIDWLLPTFKSWTVQKRIYNVRTIVWPLNIYRSTTAYFFEPPCIYVGIVWLYYLLLMSEVCKTVFSCLTFADVAYPSVRPSSVTHASQYFVGPYTWIRVMFRGFAFGGVSKRLRLDESNWFLARRLPSTYPALCYKKALVSYDVGFPTQ